MGVRRLVLFCLILAEILVAQATDDKSGMNPFEADALVSGPVESSGIFDEMKAAADAPSIRRLGKHHSSDKSVAGGGVIIGGLVTAIFAAVFAYIRVTGNRAQVE